MRTTPIKAGDRVVVARAIGIVERALLGAAGVVLEPHTRTHGYARIEFDVCPVPALIHPESLDIERTAP